MGMGTGWSFVAEHGSSLFFRMKAGVNWHRNLQGHASGTVGERGKLTGSPVYWLM